jgi:hypothetical protein
MSISVRHCCKAMIEEFFRSLDQGVASFGQVGKSLLTDALSAEIVEAMDPGVSLEPLIFACFNARTIERDLPQIIFGYLSGDFRPERLSVTSNSGGAVHMPAQCNFLTNRINSALSLIWQGGEFLFKDDADELIAFDTAACPTFEAIRLPVQCHPLTEALYSGSLDCCRQSSLIAASHQQSLIEALGVLQALSPLYWTALVTCTKEIVTFADPTRNSFAALSSYGTAFINVLGSNNSIAFFLEDIIHQCGHIMFSAIDFERKKFLRVNPDTPLRDETGVAPEHRTLHTALHGLFTEALISSLLDLYLSSSIDDPIETFECRGRLMFIMNKFGHDLQYMSNRELYTPKGAQLIGCFEAIYGSIFSKRASEFRAISLGRQGYTFDVGAFFEANPAIQ